MKSIKFQELSVKNNRLQIALAILGVAFLVLGLFDVWDFLGERTVKYLTAACYLGIALYHLEPFFHRNHVRWNKRGISIRVNSFLGTNFGFANVKDIVYAEDAYTVYTYNSLQPRIIDLEGVDQGSKDKLLQILRSYTG